MAMASSTFTFSLVICLFLSLLSHSSSLTSFSKTTPSSTPTDNSPLSPKASLLRYWARKVPNKRPHPSFFTSKLSPLSPLDLTTFSLLLSPLSLSSHLPSFCSSAHLLCSNSMTSPSLSSHNNNSPSGFNSYVDSNFTNYASNGHSISVVSSFANYSDDQNIPTDNFRRYSRNSISDNDTFTSYSVNGNVVTTNFTSYGGGAVGDTGDFSAYHTDTNVPDLEFTNYDDAATGAVKGFKGYAENANHGEDSFTGYGKKNSFDVSTFRSYGNNSNVITSGFKGYGESVRIASDAFQSYGENGNVPENNFQSYGQNAVFHTVGFENYRNQSNVGDDTFTSYGKKAAGEIVTFANYGESFNEGSDTFESYGEGTTTDNINFTSYSGQITDFKQYYNNVKQGGNQFNFKSYVNASTVPHSHGEAAAATTVEEVKVKKMKSEGFVNKWVVEPGKFFRESSLKKGTVMPMPDIRDKMPARSFLPRSIATKIPFSADEVREIFEIQEDTAMGKAVANTVSECERAPSKGETKKCGTSAEDIIDFAVSVLGSDVVVRSTENTKGSGGSIMIGDVKGINGGKVTQSVSCHQSLFPYLVYYCHSVPKVRVYEADIQDVNTAENNHGVAICHIDTSDWSAGHGAFIALGSAPGKIEVCHWIFEGDMTWATAD